MLDNYNLTMLTDFYEVTMANGYFQSDIRNHEAVFDMFFRRVPDDGGFAIMAGVEQLIAYMKNLKFTDEDIDYLRSKNSFSEEFLEYLRNFKFTCDVWAVPEGTPIFPHEPIVIVKGPIIQAQFVETFILLTINHQTLIATKSNRIVRAAQGRPVMEFGTRRAQGASAAIDGARASYIAGCAGTACTIADRDFHVPALGTMAHSWVMYYDDEYTAFKRFAEIYPDNAILLVDTYDVLDSGVPNAIRVAKEVLEPMGKRLKGIRIDSGDLAYLSKKARKMLDDAGLTDAIIVMSNSLDEYTISSILEQGGCVDSFGVGERLITAKSDPVFGAVYKLVAVHKDKAIIPKIKISETFEKITNPGRKRAWRVYDKTGHAIADLLTLQDEDPRESAEFPFVDTQRPWKKMNFRDCTFRELQELVLEKGKRIHPSPSLEEIRRYVRKQLNHEIWPEEQRFSNPHMHFLDMSPRYYAMKMALLEDVKKGK